jgi:tRNA uridine 5-carboxymethylaminomethyl modification enzyme
VSVGTGLLDVLKRPHVSLDMLKGLMPELAEVPCGVAEHVEYDVKYEGFIDRQKKDVEKFRHLENIRVPDKMDYADVPGISHEVRQKLAHFRPVTLGQANRISGITPAAISILMVYLRKYLGRAQ